MIINAHEAQHKSFVARVGSLKSGLSYVEAKITEATAYGLNELVINKYHVSGKNILVLEELGYKVIVDAEHFIIDWSESC